MHGCRQFVIVNIMVNSKCNERNPYREISHFKDKNLAQYLINPTYYMRVIS
jgi:hypothetical protein